MNGVHWTHSISVFASMGLCIFLRPVSSRVIFLSRSFGLMLSITSIVCLITSSRYIVQNSAIDLLNASIALFVLSTTISVLIPMILIYINRNRFTNIFPKMHQIYGKSCVTFKFHFKTCRVFLSRWNWFTDWCIKFFQNSLGNLQLFFHLANHANNEIDDGKCLYLHMSSIL